MKPLFSLQNKKIWVAGHQGMVGSALLRRLSKENCQILTVSRNELDLRNQAAVREWMASAKLDAILLAAAKVGGIKANSDFPASFLYDNLLIAANVIHAAYQERVSRLLYLGSSCIYPKLAPQPITEDALLTGLLEPTNEPYALAKIAGVKLCQSYRVQYGCDFISAMPCNLYGPNDSYHPEHAHVIPALIAKLHAARMRKAPSVTLWGTGTPKREFLFVDDLAEGLVTLLQTYEESSPVNIGSGGEITITALASKIAAVVGYQGKIEFDPSMPDGTHSKLLDSSKIRKTGWQPKTSLEVGLHISYSDYLARGYAQAA